MVFTNDIDAQPTHKATVLHALPMLLVAVGFVGMFIGMHTAGAGLLVGGAAGHLLLGVFALAFQRRRSQRSKETK